MKEQPEVTVVTRRANQIRNLGKERSDEMHAQNAVRIDRQAEIAEARKERRAAKKQRLRAL